MKAIRIQRTGGPEVLALEEVGLADPGPGEVRIRHSAIGVNFIDTYHRSGLYEIPLPAILGSEAAGTVVAAGQNVEHLKEGDRVVYCGVLGAYAEEANVPAWRALKLPAAIDDETAAAALLKGLTAQYLLKETFPIKAGQSIVVHAAAGGVGLILCQWASHLGVEVIGVVGSADKVNLAKDAGCAHVINASKDNIAARVRALTKDEGVPVVYDSVGKDTFGASLDSLAVRGLLVSFGNASGAIPPFAPGILSQKGSLYLTRPTLVHYTRNREEMERGAKSLFDVIESHIIRIAINQRFALSDARKAHETLHARATTGATVLLP